jgi:hypothetical protein
MILGDATTKASFASIVRAESASFLQSLDRLSELQKVYNDRGYNSGGADEILDSDVESVKITADNLEKILGTPWFLSRLILFVNGGVPSTGLNGYQFLDEIRSDI